MRWPSQRAIARSLGVSKGSIDNYLWRVQIAGLGWPLAENLSDEALYDKLFPSAAASAGAGDRSRTGRRATRSCASRA